MIIFDTNAVNLLPPGGLRADIIRKLRTSKRQRVGVPWMVLEEMSAHKALQKYPTLHEEAQSALAKLRKEVPWDLESPLERLDLERFKEHWSTVYSDIFEVIDTSGVAARRALAREALALAPTKETREGKTGGRDAAIWFSLLEFLEDNPNEHVYFVTNNSKDFGNGHDYPEPMDEDVRLLGGRLTYLSDFDEVIERFTKEVSGEAEKASVDALLRTTFVRGGVAQAALASMGPTEGANARFSGCEENDQPVRWCWWLAAPGVELLSFNDVTGHEIEGEVWYTAQIRWLLRGAALDEGGELRTVSCLWPVKMLFSTGTGKEEGEPPTLLADHGPTPPRTSQAETKKLLEQMRQDVSAEPEKSEGGEMPDRSPVVADMQYPALAQYLNSVGLGVSLQRSLATQLAPFADVQRRLAEQQMAQFAPLADMQRRLAQQMASAMPKLDIATGPYQGKVQRIEAARKAAQSAAKSVPDGDAECEQDEADELGETCTEEGKAGDREDVEGRDGEE